MEQLRQLMQNEHEINFNEVISHESLIACIKNQDPILKKIFTRNHLLHIIQFMIKQQTQLSKAAILHNSVTEVLSCECHLITDQLFGKSSQQSQEQPLIYELFKFLNGEQHYVLASNFSRVIVAITKRVFSPAHKYNRLFCKIIFQENYLIKTLNHFYSLSTIQYVIKWLSLSTQIGELVMNYNEKKNQFLCLTLQKLNSNSLSQTQANSVKELFTTLFTQKYETNKVNNELFSLACNSKIFALIFEVREVHSMSKQKIKFLKRFIQRLRQAEQNAGVPQQKKLYSLIEVEILQEIFNWCFLSLKSEFAQRQKQKSNKDSNGTVLAILQLIETLHKLSITKQYILYYYRENASQVSSLIKEIMLTKNNLIQLAVSRIVFPLVNEWKCPEFGQKLLSECIVDTIEEPSAKIHALKWAEAIMLYSQLHIFQNQGQQQQWQHIKEQIQLARDLKIGTYKLKPSNLSHLYSIDTAKIYYSKFLKVKPIIIYQNQVQSKKALSQQQKVSNEQLISEVYKLQKHKSQQISVKQQKPQNDEYLIESIRVGYLIYQLEDLLSEL